jgi:integrase
MTHDQAPNTVACLALVMRHVRRTCARLCHAAGGELEQIQFLLGHAFVQTTERYIGCKQDLSRANDRLRFASGRA